MEELDLKILNFLNNLANKTDDGYLWREVCELIKQIEDIKNLTIPVNIMESSQIPKKKIKCRCVGMVDKVKCGFDCYN